MCGRSVWYPMGWDDNGLPTERRVQNYYGVRWRPVTALTGPGSPRPVEGGLSKGQSAVAISRPNFVELCERWTAEDERAFRNISGATSASRWTGASSTRRSREGAPYSQLAFYAFCTGARPTRPRHRRCWDIGLPYRRGPGELVDRNARALTYPCFPPLGRTGPAN